jgi:major membrane immunogen (membrane-anchored lipoprotein)
MKHYKILIVIIAAGMLGACSSHKMGKMSYGGELPKTSSLITSTS